MMIRNGNRYYLTREESNRLCQNDVQPIEESLRLRNEFFNEISKTIVDAHTDKHGAFRARAIGLDEDSILNELENLKPKRNRRQDELIPTMSANIHVSNKIRTSYEYKTSAKAPTTSGCRFSVGNDLGVEADSNISIVAA